VCERPNRSNCLTERSPRNVRIPNFEFPFSLWTLFITPYQSSNTDTAGTQICSPDSPAFENRFRARSDIPLISAMPTLVSSKYAIVRLSVEKLAAWSPRLFSAGLE
jgi:hypothetical protein